MNVLCIFCPPLQHLTSESKECLICDIHQNDSCTFTVLCQSVVVAVSMLIQMLCFEVCIGPILSIQSLSLSRYSVLISHPLKSCSGVPLRNQVALVTQLLTWTLLSLATYRLVLSLWLVMRWSLMLYTSVVKDIFKSLKCSKCCFSLHGWVVLGII